MGRPLMHDGKPFCATGRESGISRCVWRDDWLYIKDGGLLPPETIDHPADAALSIPVTHTRLDWLHTPHPERLFHIDSGALVLTRWESIGSWFEQFFVVRRQEHAAYDVSTSLEFNPDCYQ
jgi:xylan 1,4-beta-xylosidase